MEQDHKIWNEIEDATQEYEHLKLSENFDYQKFFMYSIVAHSTAIEGSTLTESDILMLFEEGLTANGKPYLYHAMNEDLKNAYFFAVKEAKSKQNITPDFLKKLNALVMKSTGSVHNMMTGNFDSSKGEYRLCGVTVGLGGESYINYQKVPEKITQLSQILSEMLPQKKNMKETYTLSFDAHFNLVSIHPWIDGNGRTSRLLMNYIQFYHDLVPTKIHKEDKKAYIESLVASREKERALPFRNFMAQQHLKTLKEEIINSKKQNKKGFTLIF